MEKTLKDRIKEIIPILEEYKIRNAFIGCFQGKGIDPNEHLMIYITSENIEYEFLYKKREDIIKEGRVPELFIHELDKILTYELEDRLNISIEITIVPTNYAKQLYSQQDKMPCIIMIKNGESAEEINLDNQTINFQKGVKALPDMVLKNCIPNIFSTLTFSIPRMEYISTLENFLNPKLHAKSKFVFAMRDRVLQDYFRAYKDILEISRVTDLGNMEFYEKRCAILDKYSKKSETNCIRKIIGTTLFEFSISDEILELVWKDHQNMREYALQCAYQVRSLMKSLGQTNDNIGDGIDFIKACKQNKNSFLSQDLDIYEKRIGMKKETNRDQFKQILNS
ncbi:hypothetical protein [uncultured Clostridium sp.]|uniref:hypothetical protein n=1 Tax=uncultured Clostridium sp. TaxID=59620 RepID=UPI0028E78EE5|nr:hypothetical protein [uncultured Clostridium sp.]